MTAKRKLLLNYLVLLAWIFLGILITLTYSIILGMLFIFSGSLVKKLSSPFPKHRFRYSHYGLPGKVYAGVLGAGLAGLVALSFYYGFFNHNVAYLIYWGMWIMLVACIPVFVLAISEEVKLAEEIDKKSESDLGSE
ncbi:MAG: hypothetical protein ACYS67_08550 [Planctomycetota bacterium]|jgi:high-affinity Fe2+/Pb2+ permease